MKRDLKVAHVHGVYRSPVLSLYVIVSVHHYGPLLLSCPASSVSPSQPFYSPIDWWRCVRNLGLAQLWPF